MLENNIEKFFNNINNPEWLELKFNRLSEKNVILYLKLISEL